MNFWQNWKTNSSGVVAMLAAFVDIGTGLYRKSAVNWSLDLTAIVLGLGLLFAKDNTTHSTVAQVEAASVPPATPKP